MILSMFSDAENGSKIALIKLARHLAEWEFVMIDCQFHTDHLESMGGVRISYGEYKELLEKGFLEGKGLSRGYSSFKEMMEDIDADD